MMPDSPVFSFDGNRVYFTDSFTPTIYVYEKGAVRQEVSFDFGSAAINDNFYHFEDAMASAEYLMSANEFAMVRRYLHSKEYKIVEVNIQKRDGVEISYKDSEQLLKKLKPIFLNYLTGRVRYSICLEKYMENLIKIKNTLQKMDYLDK